MSLMTTQSQQILSESDLDVTMARLAEKVIEMIDWYTVKGLKTVHNGLCYEYYVCRLLYPVK